VSDETITFLILGAVVAVFIWDKLPVAIVAIGVALSLWATDVLTLEQALAGFGDPSVLFIASLFVVSEALDAAGVTGWMGQELVGRSGDSRTRALVLAMVTCAALTALITPNGSVVGALPGPPVSRGNGPRRTMPISTVNSPEGEGDGIHERWADPPTLGKTCGRA